MTGAFRIAGATMSTLNLGAVATVIASKVGVAPSAVSVTAAPSRRRALQQSGVTVSFIINMPTPAAATAAVAALSQGLSPSNFASAGVYVQASCVLPLPAYPIPAVRLLRPVIRCACSGRLRGAPRPPRPCTQAVTMVTPPAVSASSLAVPTSSSSQGSNTTLIAAVVGAVGGVVVVLLVVVLAVFWCRRRPQKEPELPKAQQPVLGVPSRGREGSQTHQLDYRGPLPPAPAASSSSRPAAVKQDLAEKTPTSMSADGKYTAGLPTHPSSNSSAAEGSPESSGEKRAVLLVATVSAAEGAMPAAATAMAASSFDPPPVVAANVEVELEEPSSPLAYPPAAGKSKKAAESFMASDDSADGNHQPVKMTAIQLAPAATPSFPALTQVCPRAPAAAQRRAGRPHTRPQPAAAVICSSAPAPHVSHFKGTAAKPAEAPLGCRFRPFPRARFPTSWLRTCEPRIPSAAEQFLERSGLAHLEPVLLRLGVTSAEDIAEFLDDATLVGAGVNKPIERRKLLTLARA